MPPVRCLVCEETAACASINLRMLGTSFSLAGRAFSSLRVSRRRQSETRSQVTWPGIIGLGGAIRQRTGRRAGPASGLVLPPHALVAGDGPVANAIMDRQRAVVALLPTVIPPEDVVQVDVGVDRIAIRSTSPPAETSSRDRRDHSLRQLTAFHGAGHCIRGRLSVLGRPWYSRRQ